MPITVEANEAILSAVRTRLMLQSALTDVVSDRITPNQFAGSDLQNPAVMLELRDCQQTNTLDRSYCLVVGSLVITIRSKDDAQCDYLAGAIRANGTIPGTGLDGYSGTMGSATVLCCERTDFDQSIVFDEDGDETDLYDRVEVYRIHFQLRG